MMEIIAERRKRYQVKRFYEPVPPVEDTRKKEQAYKLMDALIEIDRHLDEQIIRVLEYRAFSPVLLKKLEKCNV